MTTPIERLEEGRLSRPHRAGTVLFSLLLALSGVALWVIRHHLAPGEDDFSIYRHPSEPWWRALHLLAAPGLLLAAGALYPVHARVHWQNRLHRTGGAALLLLLLLMTGSGYLLYLTAEETWLEPLKFFHTATGAAFAGVLIGHAVSGLRALRRAAAESQRPGDRAVS